MTYSPQARRLQDAVMDSFITEINALKPGNVSVYSEGHGMTVADFIKSAELTTPILCDTSLSVGERILASVKITISEVGCNTNLGMLMLFSPLIRAAERAQASLPSSLKHVLRELDAKDAACIFAAIRKANPGGLGKSKKYSVNKKLERDVTLKMAMTEAKDRDLIAQQYVSDFADIFLHGLRYIEDFSIRWNGVQWGTVACYMGFMAHFTDSHIRRKHGQSVAEQTRRDASSIAAVLQAKDNPEEATEMLMEFDKELKHKGVNPGTSADLTAASLLVYRFGVRDL